MGTDMMKRAKEVYQLLKATLDKGEWEYVAKDEDLVIVSGCTGDDFPIKFIFRVDPQRECLTFHTSDFATFTDENFIDGALATCVANHGLVFGHFDYDVSDNTVCYTMSNSILGTEFNEIFFIDMLNTAVNTVDRYNDRFIMLSKGLIDIHKFIDLDNN